MVSQDPGSSLTPRFRREYLGAVEADVCAICDCGSLTFVPPATQKGNAKFPLCPGS